jgi:hypothetical protein
MLADDGIIRLAVLYARNRPDWKWLARQARRYMIGAWARP